MDVKQWLPLLLMNLIEIMGRIERSRELASRRARRKKLKQLRAKYAEASSDADKQVLVEKAYRVSPFASLESETGSK